MNVLVMPSLQSMLRTIGVVATAIALSAALAAKAETAAGQPPKAAYWHDWTDGKGDAAKITIKNVMQSNGVIHVIDTVLLPS